MRISELVKKLQEILEDGEDLIVLVDSPSNENDFEEVIDVVGKSYGVKKFPRCFIISENEE